MYSFARLNTRLVTAAVALPAIAAFALTGCSAQAADDAKSVTLVVHDSFVDGEEFAQAAQEATGYDVEVVTAGDGGELSNKLVLTQGAPIADAFFGIDNTFASRMVEHGVAAPIEIADLPERAAELAEPFAVPGEPGLPLIPVDLGATCVNVDTQWFASQGIEEPHTFDDLVDPAYRDLTVLLDPTASSTGASFLIATVAAYGEDGFASYWEDLVANGARIDQGWEDAYYGDFTATSETGTYPIVVSYSTSPAFTVNESGTESTTRALLDTCSTQVEFAGVLKGAANPEGAQAVIEYLLSEEFQRSIPDAMYMYPVDEAVALPDEWAEFAPLPNSDQVHDMSSEQIGAGIEQWLDEAAAAAGL